MKPDSKTWTNVDPGLGHYMAPLGHNELNTIADIYELCHLATFSLQF